MGKTTNKELERLGGVRVHEYGEGDDDNALEDDFENWKGPMWASLTQKFHPNQGSSDAGDGSGSSEGHSVTLSFECVEIGESEAKKLEINHPRASQLAASTRHFFT
jgi:sulfite reductase alpha subunit-like flavoprotein